MGLFRADNRSEDVHAHAEESLRARFSLRFACARRKRSLIEGKNGSLFSSISRLIPTIKGFFSRRVSGSTTSVNPG
jgi:hypothetical protein